MILKRLLQKVGGSGNISSGTGNVTVNKGISPEVFAQQVAKYAKELGETKQIINGFFGTLLKEKVPRDQWDAKLREIAAIHKELLERLSSVQSEDPEVVKLKQEAKQAIEKHEYDKAEELLKKAEARDLEAIEKMEQTARQRRISAAATNVDQAKLQRVQLRYAKAAAYWQKAAALLPEGEKKDRAYYLNAAGYDLDRISRYSEALPLYEQSLSLRQEIGDRAGEGTTLNNIGEIHRVRGDYDKALAFYKQSLYIFRETGSRLEEGTTLNNISLIYDARGDYDKALKYLEQSLKIRQEVGDRAGEGVTQNNISGIHWAQGDYTTALKYLEQSLEIRQEIGDRAGEGTTLNNIATTAYAKGDYDKALKYLEQSLEISQEIGDKRQEAITSWNIGWIYQKQGDLAKAEQYISRAVEIAKAIGHPLLEKWREGLEIVRTAIKRR
ncbi:MAG: tetratricopeptide repeat protein [Candidatus Electrothrix sp. LOE2]|nr:tetratricopeptide repeat protein [Candidatus Electrothrix sp. LOE2]